MLLAHIGCWIDSQHLAHGRCEFLFEILGELVLLPELDFIRPEGLLRGEGISPRLKAMNRGAARLLDAVAGVPCKLHFAAGQIGHLVFEIAERAARNRHAHVAQEWHNAVAHVDDGALVAHSLRAKINHRQPRL